METMDARPEGKILLESGEEITSKILKIETTHVTAKESKRVALEQGHNFFKNRASQIKPVTQYHH